MTAEIKTAEPKIRTWIYVHTAPQAEFAVRYTLVAAECPVLLPTGAVEVRHTRRYLAPQSVFPRFVFSGLPEGMSLYPIRAMMGVLSTAGRPCPVLTCWCGCCGRPWNRMLYPV